MSLAVMLMGCGFDPHQSLRSADPETRIRAVWWMDRDEMRAELPLLLEMAASDPAPQVRAEVLRELGWTLDPSVLPVLRAASTTHPLEVVQSFVAYGGVEGCMAAREVEVPHDERVYRWFVASPCFQP